MADRQLLAERFQDFSGESVWTELGQLARENNALNFGPGFPDFFPPEYLLDAMVDTIRRDPLLNQYSRNMGHQRLVKAISKLFSAIMGREIDPMKEILVSTGASGALYSSVASLVNPGDECILIEPFYESYKKLITSCGGIPVYVPLRQTKASSNLSIDWKLDPAELASKFNSKTKLILLNTPNNPLGKVFTLDELQIIADLCIKHDVVCISDDVYEWLLYDGHKHIKIATLPGMWDRTITISSGGKTFSATGWKVGWSIAPNHLMKCVRSVHQCITATCATPTQEAIAVGLEKEFERLGTPECYFNELPALLKHRRDRMVKLLEDFGIKPIIPDGGFFICADLSLLDVDYEDGSHSTNDFKFVRWIIKNKKLAVIPGSVFYGKENVKLGENMIRFCFAKKEEMIDKLEAILKEWKNNIS